MENAPHNPSCALSGTKYCRLLNMHACETCTIRESQDLKAVREDIDLYETLLPEGGVARLFNSKECQFCKGPKKGERKGYAIMDMAHPEPKRVQQWLFGKRRIALGTMIPVQFAICPRCRRRFLLIEYASAVTTLLFGAGGLVLVAREGINKSLTDIGQFMPIAAWLVLLGVGILLGRLLSGALEKRFAKDMLVHVMEHPVIREMTEKGWTPLAKRSRTRLLFSKSRMARGLGTAEDTE